MDTWCYWHFLWAIPLQDHSLRPTIKECLDPWYGSTSDSIVVEFEDKLFMIHLIKGFAEIKQDNVSLLTFFQVPMNFLDKHSQLSFTGPFWAKTMLEIIQDLVWIKMFHKIGCNYMFKYFTKYACEVYGPVICRAGFVSLFVNGWNICFEPFRW